MMLDEFESEYLPNTFSQVDHLVYAAPDLDRGIAELERLTGIRATAGGSHPGWGTRNALIALGPDSYIEVIAPDPGQPEPKIPRPFGIDQLAQPKLVAWAAKGRDLENVRENASTRGVRLGEVLSGSRRRTDGVQISWQFTSPWTVVEDGIVPFLIDWGTSSHPARSAAQGLKLVELRAEHPEPERIRKLLQSLEVPLKVTKGIAPALVAVVEAPSGRVEVR